MSILESVYRAASLPISWTLYAAFSCVERGRERLNERRGYWNLPSGDYLWLHGASLGENQGLIPLIKKIKERLPETKVLMSATSLSGLKNLDGVADEVRLFPFDTPPFIERALSGVTVRAFIATETELWPNLLRILNTRSIPSALVNARISDLTAKSYQIFQSLFDFGLKNFKAVAVADNTSRVRFESLGLSNAQLTVTGNTKFDRSPSVTSPDEAAHLRGEFFQNEDPVLVIGSLHHDELDVWLPALVKAQEEGRAINILVAPRRPERFPEFRERLSERGLKFHLRSEGMNAQDTRLVLLNTLGELEKVYAFADGCFIGGTINELGGHNPLEAAQYGAAIALGPNVHTIREIAAQLRQKDCLFSVKDSKEAEAFMQKIALKDDTIRKAGAAAQEVWRLQHGATERVLNLLVSNGVL